MDNRLYIRPLSIDVQVHSQFCRRRAARMDDCAIEGHFDQVAFDDTTFVQ
jgi:hypothetical protein